jgi:DNA primase
MAVIDEVRERLDIVEVISGYTPLKRAGRSYKARCPFHDEKTPSFVVFPESGTWRCFGACGTGGDLYAFVMRAENTDFRGALELLARRAGVALEAPSPQATLAAERRERLRAALAAAAAFYHRQLLAAPAAEPARAYLAGRGFGAESWRRFELGFAPGAGSPLAEALRAQGFAPELLLASGLAREREAGGVYDLFRGRLLFPIRDERGRAIGFGARAIEPGVQPKYLNSPQTELFDKGTVLYGLDQAAASIRASGEAVVVEGYTDVIRAHGAGAGNVVASLGTALTMAQVQALKRRAKRIVLALDADAAGQAATVRGLAVAQEAATGEGVLPVPTAAGLVRYVHQLDVDLRVAMLPAGQDPDEVIAADPEAWRALVRDAVPVMTFLIEAVAREVDLDTPRGKSEATERLLPFLQEIPDPVLRSAWVAEVGARLRVDERSIETRLTAPRRAERSRRRPSGPQPEGATAPPQAGTRPLGLDLGGFVLAHLLAAPRRLKDLNARLRQDPQPPLGGQDFDHPLDRDLLAAVRLAGLGVPPPDAAPEERLDALPPEHAARAEALLALAAAAPPASEAARVAALHAATLRLRERALRRALEGLRFLQAEAAPEEQGAYTAQVLAHAVDLASLQRLLAPDTGR